MHTLFPGEGGISDLLAMIERRAPLLLRCGGCAVGNGIGTENAGRPITPEMKQRFAAMLRAGHSLDEIAAETGVHYQTVAQHTREVRAAIGYTRRRRSTA